jgi:flagellar basal body-associated protein FliL
MVRLAALLIIASVLYYVWVVTQSNNDEKNIRYIPPSIITVEELPPIREENE